MIGASIYVRKDKKPFAIYHADVHGGWADNISDRGMDIANRNDMTGLAERWSYYLRYRKDKVVVHDMGSKHVIWLVDDPTALDDTDMSDMPPDPYSSPAIPKNPEDQTAPKADRGERMSQKLVENLRDALSNIASSVMEIENLVRENNRLQDVINIRDARIEELEEELRARDKAKEEVPG